jgi:hypothetical protein
MANVTYSVAVPIVRDDSGDWVALEGAECPTGHAAQRRAQALADKHGGAVAFSRTGDPASGEFADAVILGRYGETPDDLMGLLGG